jgi:hypothetical protein
MAELERTLAKCPHSVTPWIVFYKPSTAAADWVATDLWHTAQTIPGAKIVTDPNGAEARRFGAQTSGETLVYDSEGQLQFSGGITTARGHEGDSAGKSAVLEILNHRETEFQKTPVYGCSIAPCVVAPEAAKTSKQDSP